ncbi:unnamed protein product [Cylicocyclus nassatus]|uniref:Uncharacterized protein n=1 Tax=Cylicocyclus nassatus TaxID=53992 RepID=A0AA36M2E0_CYLNA|nr:unnamed protein product [Cylicocyclus nassatus]
MYLQKLRYFPNEIWLYTFRIDRLPRSSDRRIALSFISQNPKSIEMQIETQYEDAEVFTTMREHEYATIVFRNRTNEVPVKHEHASEFSAASLSVRAQKKIASKLSTRKTTKLFLKDSIDQCFDSFYHVLRTYYSKKDSEKVIKNIIKLSVKLAILSLNDMLSKEDLERLDDVQRQLHSLLLTVVSFVKVEYSFERTHLIELLRNMQSSLVPLVSLKLSDKSTKRLEHVISHVTKIEFLDGLFKVNGPHADVLDEFITRLESLLDSGDL